MKMKVSVITNGVLIVKNAPQITLVNTCGIGNHTIIGTLLINFRNCSVILEGKAYDNLETKIHAHPEILPLFNVKINQVNEKHQIDLHELQDLNLQHHKRIEEINATQKNNNFV